MRTLLLVFLLISTTSFSQREYVDSLLLSLKKSVKNDTMRAFQYNELAWVFLDINVDSSLQFSKKGLHYSQQISYLNGEMDALNTQGIIFRYQSNYSRAIAIYEQLINLAHQRNKPEKLTGYYSNLGSVYYEQAVFGKALAYYKKAYENAEQLNQVSQKLILINNLGVGFKQVGLYDKALEWLQIGLKEAKKSGDKIQEGTLYGNIATVYFDRGSHEESMKYSLKALQLLKEEDALARAPNLLFNLIIDYRQLNDYKAAKNLLSEYKLFASKMDDSKIWSDYYLSQAKLQGDLLQFKEAETSMEKAISFVDLTVDPLQYGILMTSKAQIYKQQRKLNLALESARIAETSILKTEDSTSLISLYGMMKELYEQSSNYKEALHYAGLESLVKSRMESAAIQNQLATLNAMNELEQKEQALQMATENTKRIAAESDRKSSLIYGMVAVGILTLIVLFVTYRSNVNRKRANEILSNKNDEIAFQKQIIESKQEEILASIHYAKRIQETLLAQQEVIQSFLPESFILFKPKDIVSGDFYWGSVVDDKLYLAICDSTGHGVPGAFMSALNSSFLNEAVNQMKLNQPGAIFDHVRKRLIESISHDGAKDGMDGILFCFDRLLNRTTYAAAYNPPIVIRGEEVIKGETDRMPVGLSDKMNTFSTFTLDLQAGDYLYATTDGFIDQFGGKEQKKLKWKGFIDLLLQVKARSPQVQQASLEQFFDNWKEQCEQIDDVCVLGISWK